MAVKKLGKKTVQVVSVLLVLYPPKLALISKHNRRVSFYIVCLDIKKNLRDIVQLYKLNSNQVYVSMYVHHLNISEVISNRIYF